MGGAIRGRRWDSGIVPYVIDPNFTEVDLAEQAIQRWESQTSLRFVVRTRENDYVRFVPHSARCSSQIGRRGGQQLIQCAPPPFRVPSYIHEVGHAIGLIHEHTRSDRNDWVTVNFANIEDGLRHNFDLVRNSVNGPVYDFVSIMHYGPDAFSRPRTGPTLQPNDPAQQLNGSTDLTPHDVAFINSIYPNLGVVRRGDSTSTGAGAADEIAVNPRLGEPVFAIRTGSGNMKLISFNVSRVGGVARIGDSGSQAGRATDLAVDEGRLLVTALRTGDGNLKLISWDRSRAGFQRQADSGTQAGKATLIRILNLTPTIFVTGLRTSANNLKLIVWRLRSDGSFSRLADSGNLAGEIRSLDMIEVRGVGSARTIATTIRTASGNAKIIVWSVSTTNGRINRLGDSGRTMGAGTQITTAIAPNGNLIVALRTAKQNLKLIAYSVSNGGDRLTRLGDSGRQAGRCGKIALIPRPYGVLSAISQGSGNLKLIKWTVDNTGISRLGDSGPDQAGEVRLISLVATGRSDAPVAAGIQTGSGKLKVITWDDLSTTGELQR